MTTDARINGRKAIKDGEYGGFDATEFLTGVMLEMMDSEPVDCGEQHIGWAFNRLMGCKVQDHIPALRECFERLDGYSASEPFVYCDMDYSVWVEPKLGRTQVLVSHCAVAMRDDNTQIFILEDSYLGEDYHPTIHVRDLHPRALSAGKYMRESFPDRQWTWYKNISLNLFKKMHWKPEYGDARDDGYVLTYNRNGTMEVDDALPNAHGIRHALWNLRILLQTLKEEEG